MSTFKFRLIQFLSRRPKSSTDKGFTLIELLVTIIIIGLLASVALPQFLNQAKKARLAEAKSLVGSAIRGQMGYKLDSGNWAATCADLKNLVEIPADNATNFNYDCNSKDETDGTKSLEVTATGKQDASSYKDLTVTGTYNPVSGELILTGKDGTTVI